MLLAYRHPVSAEKLVDKGQKSLRGVAEIDGILRFELSYDLFGKNIVIANYGERFEFTSKVMLGNKFYAWILSHGDRVRVVTPESLNGKLQNMTAPFAPLNEQL